MTTLSQPRPGNRQWRKWLPIIAAALVVTLAIGLIVQNRFAQSTTTTPNTATVERGPLALEINATGVIEPRETADLAFTQASGRVSEVLVSEGAPVKANDALITLDTRRLAADVAAAEAALAQAQADLQGITEGATPEEIAAARAQVEVAQGSLTQTRGSVTSADVRAAQAAIAEARARVAELEAGPGREVRTAAETTRTQAQANLDQQRAALSADKEQARRTVEERANALQDAQSAYSTAFWDLELVKGDSSDPRTLRPLTESQEQDFVAAFERAQRDLANAETSLAQAQVDYEAAKAREATGLADAEARLNSAVADLDDVLAGADADELAAARAQLARAEADLTRLQGAEQQGAVASQEGNVRNAQAQLDQLLADPKASDLARAEAQVAQAEAQLERARIDLEEATLRAPFAGLVGNINVAPGESIGQEAPITLLDISRYIVKLEVDEVDVARVAPDQQVEVLIDALGAPALSGVVRSISPLASDEEQVTSYEVTVEVDPADRLVKAGMTASAAIVIDRVDTALSVPEQAVRTENGQTVVTVAAPGDNGAMQTTTQPVETGLEADGRIEIRSGLTEGQQVIIP
jgi:RND family efflux transporter MFP subunit